MSLQQHGPSPLLWGARFPLLCGMGRLTACSQSPCTPPLQNITHYRIVIHVFIPFLFLSSSLAPQLNLYIPTYNSQRLCSHITRGLKHLFVPKHILHKTYQSNFTSSGWITAGDGWFLAPEGPSSLSLAFPSSGWAACPRRRRLIHMRKRKGRGASTASLQSS